MPVLFILRVLGYQYWACAIEPIFLIKPTKIFVTAPVHFKDAYQVLLLWAQLKVQFFLAHTVGKTVPFSGGQRVFREPLLFYDSCKLCRNASRKAFFGHSIKSIYQYW